MTEDRLEKSALIKAAGIALGLVAGGVLGPIVFHPPVWSVPPSAAHGSAVRYFDLATPYFAIEHPFNHMGLSPEM